MTRERTATFCRETRETRITVAVELDRAADNAIKTTLPFLDHLLEAFATHGRIGLQLEAVGDTQVDPHHLIEDCGLALGTALAQALGGAEGILRAGFFLFPMDGSLAEVAIDLCGRPNLVWKVQLRGDPLGTFDPALARDFMKGFSDSLRATVHVAVRYSDNDHHALEAVFKALGRALREAVTPAGDEVTLSSKGKIDD